MNTVASLPAKHADTLRNMRDRLPREDGRWKALDAALTALATPAVEGGLLDERAAAEHAYTVTAFDYEHAPVGSRDWTLFWKGWQAARRLATPEQPGSAVQGEVEYEFEVWQDDAMQAGGSTTDYATAKGEADHYALMYGQDGPVEVRMYEKRQIIAALAGKEGVK